MAETNPASALVSRLEKIIYELRTEAAYLSETGVVSAHTRNLRLRIAGEIESALSRGGSSTGEALQVWAELEATTGETWRPIDSAPEGEYVIVWVPNAGWRKAIRTRDDWWDGEEIIVRPSHWQPQPTWPKAALSAPSSPASPTGETLRGAVETAIMCAQQDCLVNPQFAGGLQPIIGILQSALSALSSQAPLPADYETNPRACRQCGLSLAACFRWRGGQTPQPCCDACNHEAAISDPSSHGVLVIDTSKTYERIHDTSETLPRVDPQAVALALGAAPSSPSLPSAALSETPAPPAHQRAARIAKAVFQEVPLSAAERLPDPDPFEAPSSQATPPAGSTPLDAFVSRIRAGREDLRVILGCPCEFCVTKRTKAASLPSMSPEVAASGSQGEGARRQAALVPLLDAAICEACGHLWCYHTSGGMCQGTRKGIECYCCLIPDAKDRARCEPAAPSSSPALSGQTNDDEKTATRSPSPDVIPATGSPRSPQPGDSHGWQLIETAPTNISVLVFIPNAEHYGVGIYRAIHVDMGTGRRWMTTGLHVGRDVGPDYQPTRWMPLPPSPVTQE